MHQKDRYGEISSKSPVYSDEQLGSLIWYEKLPFGQNLDLIFVTDEVLSKTYSKPLDYITYLIKYSGKGSLIEYLKKNKLAVKIEAGPISTYKHFSQYAISVYLTKKGLKEVKNVMQICFNYINLMRKKKPNSNLYNDIKKISEIQYL